jgi:hypothetical protein
MVPVMVNDEPMWDDDDAPLPDGDVVASPMPAGARVTLRFASPFEPWLTLAGARVHADHGGETRALWLWFGRRQAALWRALDVARGLRATLSTGSVVVTDVVDLEDGAAVDHGSLMASLEGARVKWPAFAVLGASMGSRPELAARARALYAAGTQLDVRVEDGQRVRGRRRLRVGRA